MDETIVTMIPAEELVNNEDAKAADEVVKFKGRYSGSVGRRKTAVAQVRLYKGGQGAITVNGKKLSEYFGPEKGTVILQPLKLTKTQREFNFSVLVKGGGKAAQLEAVRHGIARALVVNDEEMKPVLRAKGWLTRDSRATERKKPGLKKARRAPQWAKR